MYKRCDPELRQRVVAEYLSGTSTAAQICRKYEISSGMLYYWKKIQGDGRLVDNPPKEGVLEKRVAELEQMVGRLTMENELLKKSRDRLLRQTKRRGSLLPLVVPKDGLSKGCVKP